MNNYVDMDGVENVACGIIKQAKKDFVKGACVLYSIMGRIPTQKELLADKKHCTLSNDADVRWMYDAWRFVKQDPYELFSPGEEAIIDAWTEEAILKIYSKLYSDGAMILYDGHSKKNIQDIPNDELVKLIQDDIVRVGFIKARDHVAKRFDADQIFKDWNMNAYFRRANRISSKRGIQNTEEFKQRQEKRRKNIEKAKELFEAGISIKAIAKEMNVQVGTIRKYLHS